MDYERFKRRLTTEIVTIAAGHHHAATVAKHAQDICLASQPISLSGPTGAFADRLAMEVEDGMAHAGFPLSSFLNDQAQAKWRTEVERVVFKAWRYAQN